MMCRYGVHTYLGAPRKTPRGAAESRLNCCRVSGETARFAGRGSETLGRVGVGWRADDGLSAGSIVLYDV